MLQFRTRANPEGAWVNAAGEPVEVLLMDAGTLLPGNVPCYEFTKVRTVPAALGCKPKGAQSADGMSTQAVKKAARKKSHG